MVAFTVFLNCRLTFSGVWRVQGKLLGMFSSGFPEKGSQHVQDLDKLWERFWAHFRQLLRTLWTGFGEVGRGVVWLRTGWWLCGFTHAWSHNVTVQTWLETGGSSVWPSPISDSKPPPKTNNNWKENFSLRELTGPGQTARLTARLEKCVHEFVRQHFKKKREFVELSERRQVAGLGPGRQREGRCSRGRSTRFSTHSNDGTNDGRWICVSYLSMTSPV